MLIDSPQIAEGSKIKNATVDSGTAFPALPNAGELFYRTDLEVLYVYNDQATAWAEAGSTGLDAHIADQTLHLTSAQNILLDGLASTLTSTELNYVDGVTSPIQTQLDSNASNLTTHTADQALHLTPSQNTLLDGLASTLTAAELNYVDGVTSPIQTQLDSITTSASSLTTRVSTLETTTVPAVQSNLDTHIADSTVHVTSAEHTWLTGVVETNGITVAEVQKLSGASALSGTIKQNLDSLSSGKLSINGSLAMTGNLDLGGNRIISVGTPQSATDAVNRDYVDQLQQGIFWKAPVVVATTANITLSGLQTIDGIALSAGNRVLVKNQTTASENGLWDAASGAWSRSADAAVGSNLSSAAVFVREGSSFSDTAWVCTSDTATAGTDSLTFVQFSAAGGITAGSGITVSGSTVSANIGNGLTFSSNAIVVNPKAGSLAFSSGQLDLTSISQAASGNFVKITLDGYGRVTGNTAVVASDISSLVDSRYVLKSGDTLMGNLSGTAFRATQGTPNNGNSSTNGFAFGADGDTGLFAEGSTNASTALDLFLNSVNVLNATASTITFGFGTPKVIINSTPTGTASTTSIIQPELYVNGAISTLSTASGQSGQSLNNFASTYDSIYGTSTFDDAQIFTISNQNAIIANGANANDTRLLSFGGYKNGLSFIRNPNGGGLVFAVGATESARFSVNRNLLVGTTTDTGARVTIAGSSTSPLVLNNLPTTLVCPELVLQRSGSTELSSIGQGASIQLVNISNNSSVMLQHFANNFQIFNNTGGSWAERLRLDSSGNLGVGTVPYAWHSSQRAFDLASGCSLNADPSSAAGMSLSQNGFYNGAATWVYKQSGIPAARYDLVNGAHYWSVSAAGTANAAIAFNTAMTLDTGATLFVGTSSAAATSGGIVLIPANGGAGVSQVNIGHISGSSSGAGYVAFTYNGSIIGSITQSGTTSVAFNTTSDYRLKNNPIDLTASGAFIDALQPKSWTWKADGTAGVGFIAHELQEISPSSVTGTKDAVDEAGEPIYQQVSYNSSELIANMVAELKALRARVAELEAKLA